MRVRPWLRVVLYHITCKLVWFSDRPSSMLRRGRPEQQLVATESIYLRWWGDHFEQAFPLPAQIATPDQSGNRSVLGGNFGLC